MLDSGYWLDSNHGKWQPRGCMMHQYSTNDSIKCMEGSRIVFAGDSIVRNLFFAVVRRLNPTRKFGEKVHADLRYEDKSKDIIVDFIWDSYLNTSKVEEIISGGSANSNVDTLVAGTGLWYLRYVDDSFNLWKSQIDRIANQVQSSPLAFILSPVLTPNYDKLNSDRRATITPDGVDQMNSYLKNYQGHLTIPYAWDKMSQLAPTETEDGLHYSNKVTDIASDILFNFRCNGQLLSETPPLTTTCCYQYPLPNPQQFLVWGVFIVLIPMGLLLRKYANSFKDRSRRVVNTFLPSSPILWALVTFGISILYLFLCDRTALFGKVHKMFSGITFTVLTLLTLLVAYCTLQEKEDSSFLNRFQTDEWKGWMQIVILIYHYVGASGVSGIYNPVRILVASYLFMTGYGHFVFFYKKGDFGLSRVLSVLVRLNLLTFFMTYAMNTTYLSYYFSPLVTVWFIVIYFSMFLFCQYNKNTGFLLVKIALSALACHAVVYTPGVLEALFRFLGVVFNCTGWSANEWRFRMGLDIWIVFIGMLVAFLNIKYHEYQFHEHPHWRSIRRYAVVFSVVTIVWFFWFELSRSSKFEYNRYHPYVSWLPILAFVILRNATERLRKTTSQFFLFFGKCSLETFLCQFHMWLAADTKGLLTIFDSPNLFWLNFIIMSTVFVFLSHILAGVTGELTSWICSTKKPTRKQDTSEATTGLLSEENVEESEGFFELPRFTSSPAFKLVVFLASVAIMNRI
ncbi:Cas1p-domain-containing protein [Basidiobolus meristosporus CBS 931.73]|uniref:Cas1p-domain-containing protein n=1 Tax=Basidiobolus meristosporus CBS 931.73 TaxID=1314790 RepID=A0A1Y1YNR5_9FUNG|nr:Cas1p-domain-containing protein [Basidiobolus meristosporus CBS 931.73]|eukprot:ORX99651.1 Cas1p-domain-containing protein [Basidiobolus meristosporus CBS 931.73]